MAATAAVAVSSAASTPTTAPLAATSAASSVSLPWTAAECKLTPAALPAAAGQPRNYSVQCARFGASGACAAGAGCPFRHVAPLAERPLPRAVCRFVACQRGDCRFFHGPAEALAALHASGAATYRPGDFLPRRDPALLPPPPPGLEPMAKPGAAPAWAAGPSNGAQEEPSAVAPAPRTLPALPVTRVGAQPVAAPTVAQPPMLVPTAAQPHLPAPFVMAMPTGPLGCAAGMLPLPAPAPVLMPLAGPAIPLPAGAALGPAGPLVAPAPATLLPLGALLTTRLV